MFPDLMDGLSANVWDRWVDYLNQPDQTRFSHVRDAVAHSASYDPLSRAMETIERSLVEGDVRSTLSQIKVALPNFLLTPRLHNMASTALRDIGDLPRSDFERRIYLLLRETCATTGDGSSEHPYLALHSCDVLDLLEYRETPVAEQYFESSSGKFYIVCETSDATAGSERGEDDRVWFEMRQVQ